MTFENISTYLIGYFIVAAVLSSIAIASVATRKSATTFFLFAVVGLIVTVILGSMVNSGHNFIVDVLARLLTKSRTDLTALGLGMCSAFPVVLLIRSGSRRLVQSTSSIVTVFGFVGVMMFGSLYLAKDVISPYLAIPGSTTGTVGLGKLTQDGFIIEEYKDTSIIPVRIAVSPSGRVFVSGHIGIAAQEGAVVELHKGADDSVVTETRVARMLNRPYGLLATDEALFVSRSGQHTKWKNGVAEQIATGAVTILKDLDGDRVMDYYHDIVVDIPGAMGPDYLHQNNDLALDSDGALYITTANNTDGHPAAHPMSGVIIKVSGENFENQRIFASGLRNPFGLEFDDKGTLFTTDNDAQSGLLGNLGDKILKVADGSYFGHPYAKDDEPGVTPPLLRSSYALGGISWMNQGALPSPWDSSLYLVMYGEGRIVRIDFNTSDAQNPIELIPVATVPGAVDIAAAPNGDLYVAVYPNKIVRIKYQSDQSTSAE